MTSANNFLAASSGGVGGNSNPLPFLYIRNPVVSLKSGAGTVQSSSAVAFFTATETVNSLMDVDQTVTINTAISTGTLEIYNVTSASGGTLTHVLLQNTTANANFDVVITRDGNNVTTIPISSAIAEYRVCLGGFLPISATATATANTQLGQGLDPGFQASLQSPASMMTPPTAFSLGLGLEFDSTCKVEIVMNSGTLPISGVTSNRSYCASMLRKRIVA